ncbi:MAG: hypothetical protein MI922_19725 [Bacteroidales bacterium]|nr:hypothetical protein [Bacteroidales bacterium]
MNKKRILVFVDFDTTRNFITKGLVQQNYQVLESKTLGDAKESLKNSGVELIIVDGDNRYDATTSLLQYVRNLPMFTYTPIIMLVTGNQEKYLPVKEEYKIAGLLTKPYDVREFYKAVERLC